MKRTLMWAMLLVVLHECNSLVAHMPTRRALRASSRLLMVATDKPPKKIQKIELTKINSNYLRDPLEGEMKNEEIFVSHDGKSF